MVRLGAVWRSRRGLVRHGLSRRSWTGGFGEERSGVVTRSWSGRVRFGGARQGKAV